MAAGVQREQPIPGRHRVMQRIVAGAVVAAARGQVAVDAEVSQLLPAQQVVQRDGGAALVLAGGVAAAVAG